MKLRKSIMRLVILTGMMLATNQIMAQMAQFQALYIYNFAKNIGWPTDGAYKDLVITVIGDNDLTQELNKLAKTKGIGSRKVVIKESATATGIEKSDIVFLGESKSSQITALVNAQKDNKVLIVSGKKGLCANGAGISFVSNGAKLGFEISQNNINSHGLQVAAKLVQLGSEVN